MKMTQLALYFITAVLLVNFSKVEAVSVNVVIFLANLSDITADCTESQAMKFLNFLEKFQVKRCTDESFGSGADCKELLKTALYSLISFCRTVLGMTTAVASLENDTFSNSLRFKRSLEDLEVSYHHPNKIKKRIETISNQEDSENGLVTKPEHTEVFRIRSKRQIFDELTDKNDPDWDIFGIVANVKLTFFGKSLDKQKSGFDSKEMMQQLGKVSDNCLFHLVKETLNSLQETQPDGSFLMIVLGGSLGEVSDIYSGLMQSVKHVVENTDEANTLIVVTGSCPVTTNLNSIPVYVRGPPKLCSLTTPTELYDVPYAIKNLLSELHGI